MTPSAVMHRDSEPLVLTHIEIANKKSTARVLFLLAASTGLEPILTESESAVLPLDDEATYETF